MFNFLSLLAFNAGLGTVQTNLVNNWIGPIYIVLVAAGAIIFLIQREIRKLLVFFIIAAVVGVLVFLGPQLFGSGGNVTRATKNVTDGINVILPFVPFLQ